MMACRAGYLEAGRIRALLILLLAGGGFQVGECREGVLTEHRAMSSVFSYFPDRQKPFVDGYVGMETLPELGRYYEMRTDGNRAVLVRAVDVLQENHREAHDKLWRGRWLADVDTALWESLGRPRWGRLCRVRRPVYKPFPAPR